MADLAK